MWEPLPLVDLYKFDYLLCKIQTKSLQCIFRLPSSSLFSFPLINFSRTSPGPSSTTPEHPGAPGTEDPHSLHGDHQITTHTFLSLPSVDPIWVPQTTSAHVRWRGRWFLQSCQRDRRHIDGVGNWGRSTTVLRLYRRSGDDTEVRNCPFPTTGEQFPTRSRFTSSLQLRKDGTDRVSRKFCPKFLYDSSVSYTIEQTT